MAHVCFRRRKWVHTRLSEKDRTQRLTRRNRGRFGWGWYHYPRTVPHVHKHPRAGYQNGKFCRFWALVGDAPEERRKPSEQRCAYARRCSEGVAAPLGCVICLQLGDVAVFFTLCAVLSERARWGWYHYPRSVPHVSETLRGQGVERQTLPLLGLGRGCSRRTQRAFGTAMRLCASLFRRHRGPAGLRDLFAIW